MPATSPRSRRQVRWLDKLARLAGAEIKDGRPVIHRLKGDQREPLGGAQLDDLLALDIMRPALPATGEAHLRVSGSATTRRIRSSQATAFGRAVFRVLAGRYQLCLTTSC